MSDIPSISSEFGASRPRARRVPFLKRTLYRLLAKISYGDITVVLPNGECLRHRGPNSGPSAKLVIRRWRTIWRLVIGGDLAFAEAYIDGDWWTPNLIAFLEFGASNDAGMKHAIAGTMAQRLLRRLQHWRRRNTRRGSQRNIAEHYDLGNEFYKLWLDRSMQYSSALFTGAGQSLEAAQESKLARIVELLEISGGERVLEIGCGWGAVMERLLPRCAVTGITLSAEQRAFAQHRLEQDRFSERASVLLQDYRDIAESYDRIVSIEMIEAVGEQYWQTYFATIRRSLSETGTAVLQAITIAEDRFTQYRQQPDFIQRYIFPGGVLPTVDIIRRKAAHAGLELVTHQPFGLDYAKTLSLWRERFLAAWPSIERLGFDQRFKRMWEYYLCYCEAGFKNGIIDVGFYKFTSLPTRAISRASAC